MKKFTTLALAALLALPVGAFALDAGEMLKKADSYRAPAQNMQLDVAISVFNPDGSVAKERTYLVFAQAKHNSLVIMQSPIERGQKVLMLGDDFWLVMPGSSRPLRITAMQKMLGDVSTGDVATMSWSDDYNATIVGDEYCDGTPCIHLTLAANRKSVTYQRIELWVGKAHSEPLKAELYVQSDKLAKIAKFVMDKPAAPKEVVAMTLLDQLSSRKETRVSYSGKKERAVPQEWLNPMFLATNPKLD